MKVWVLTMIDAGGGVGSRVFSSNVKAIAWVQAELDVDGEGEIAEWETSPRDNSGVFTFHSDALEVLFQLQEVEVDDV